MTDVPATRGLIRMALMAVAFVALTVVLIVFQPGASKRGAPNMAEPVVTRDAARMETIAPPVPDLSAAESPVRTVGPASIRDLTFDAIAAVKTATTGDAPAPGQPGSLLYSAVQRSMSTRASE
ncbi:hypothetical protein [Marivita sp. GX14005]|uniref:hypothetical protein n=1 Tax=Marivita sp. GX14005 TaxID=2942276 RepID=UPI002019A090|nr:hypothetical protein [Marivita sp. GX14005]MCL3881340.1 hypothetical protein [Marivita sp. GX14005]